MEYLDSSIHTKFIPDLVANGAVGIASSSDFNLHLLSSISVRPAKLAHMNPAVEGSAEDGGGNSMSVEALVWPPRARPTPRYYVGESEAAAEDRYVDQLQWPIDTLEDFHCYSVGGFHPVQLGDIFESDIAQYRVLHKLGYGKYATVWLAETCRDATKEEIEIPR